MERRSKLIHLSFFLKTLWKEEQYKHKASRGEKEMKIRAEIKRN